MSSNPVINYTSRTYNTVLNDINALAELTDKPDWIKKLIAGVADALFMNLNAQANNSYLRTSFTRRGTQDLLSLIDYQLTPQVQATGKLTFYIDRSASYPLNFTQAELSGATRGTVAQSAYTYNARAGVTITSAPTYTVSSVDTGADTLTTNAPASTFVTGDLIRISSTTTLPSPLVTGTDYYVITTDGTVIQLASSLANAFAGTYLNLTTAGSGTITTTTHSFSVDAWNEVYISDYINIGTGDGTDWQEFQLSDRNILQDTVAVKVGGIGGWSSISVWVEQGTTTKAFKLLFDSSNNCTLSFGGDDYGLPPTGDITVYYAVGGGALSNVSNLNRIVNYLGGNINITGVTNTTLFSGGADPETADRAKKLAPALLYAANRFVTVADGIALSKNYPGVASANVIANYYGPNTCRVAIVPTGGGTPSAGLLSLLQTYLISLTEMGSIDVRCVSASYYTVNITGTASVSSGYTWASVLSYLTLALRIMFTERGEEIIGAYNESGIAAVVTIINAQWSTSFSSSDYTTIANMIEMVESDSLYARFGVDATLFSVYSYCGAVVPGLADLVITAPTFPFSLTGSQITQINTLNITQV